MRPFLAHHDGDVELLAVDPELGAVRLRLLGSCDGCPSSAVTLQLAVERAIVEAAPEVVRIDVDDVAPAPVLAGPGDARGADPQAALRQLSDRGGARRGRCEGPVTTDAFAVIRRIRAERAPPAASRDRCASCAAR